jgi:hypothetical protein
VKVTDFDCHPYHLGLKPNERAALTGFSWRAIAALAHLREAWISADGGNAKAIEAAIRVLLSESHSLRDDCAQLAVKVLLHGHMRGAEMLKAIRP